MTRDYEMDRDEIDAANEAMDRAAAAREAEAGSVLGDLGAIIAGLQVPMSIGLPLGTAIDPYHRLRARIGLFGYLTAEECTEALTKALES